MTQTTPSHEYPEGAPCWVDLNTPDLAGAQRFYGGLFDWTFDAGDPAMGHYAMCRLGGKMVAGIAPKQPGMEMPTVWSVYLKSSDIEATAREVTQAGGTLLFPPMDIPGSGRMMFAVDPTGAAFGCWQPGDHRGAELFGTPGAMCWHEVNTRDGAAADRFYAGIFGFTQTQIGDGERFDYTVWKTGDRDVCGRMKMGSEWGDIPPHWMTYFAVGDCDASVAKIKQLGGNLMHGPFDSPHGRIAVVSDPYGAVFSIIDLETKKG